MRKRKTSCVYCESKNCPMDAPSGPLCNAGGLPLSTSWGRPLPTSLGRWNMTCWGCPHAALYVMPWDVPYQRLEDVSGRRYEDIPIRSNILLQGTCPTDVLRTSCKRRPGDVLKASLYGSISKANKPPRNKDF